MPSAVYNLIRQAILDEKLVTCVYDGRPRVLCPIIIGHSKGQEKALTFQVGGTSRSGLPAGGEWRCLYLVRVREARITDGPWREGDRHTAPQRCVEEEDIDINIAQAALAHHFGRGPIVAPPTPAPISCATSASWPAHLAWPKPEALLFSWLRS